MKQPARWPQTTILPSYNVEKIKNIDSHCHWMWTVFIL